MSVTEITITLQKGTAQITVPMQKGTALIDLNLKSRMATLDMEKRTASATLKMMRGIDGSVITGFFDPVWFDTWYDRQGTVDLTKSLKLEGDK